MSQIEVQHITEYVLPTSVVSKSDLARLVNEVEQLDNDLTTAVARNRVGATNPDNLTISEQLADFLNTNQLRLGNNQQRGAMISQLRNLKDTAPVVHMTFAATADQESLEKLVTWLRQTVHRQAVIAIGLQPSLVGGVYIRTPNRVHDFSLRARLEAQRGLLVKQIEALGGGASV